MIVLFYSMSTRGIILSSACEETLNNSISEATLNDIGNSTMVNCYWNESIKSTKLLNIVKLCVHIVIFLVLYRHLTGHTCRIPDNKVHGANMGPIWVLSAPDGPHVGPMNLAIGDYPSASEATLIPTQQNKAQQNCAFILLIFLYIVLTSGFIRSTQEELSFLCGESCIKLKWIHRGLLFATIALFAMCRSV